MSAIVEAITARGDIAHLVLFAWASSTTAILVWALRELAASSRRFEDFVTEIARLTRLFEREEK